MTFFYLLTGGPPFSGRTIYEKLIAHKESPVPNLDELVDEVTPEVNDIFQLMLAKQPDDRYASMSDLVQAIDALQADQSSLQTAPRLANEMTVLIVEKSRFQASMISKLLNQLDIDDIHVTASGAEAMAKLETTPAHIVLTSAQLPDMLGVSLAESIRDELRWSQVAVVLMASDPLSKAMTDVLSRIGASSVLQKPFNVEQLQETLDVLATAEKSESIELNALSSHNVLIVDDSKVAQRKIRQTLLDLGFVDFEIADDGLSAVELLKSQRFDLVVTDYNMPHMNGHELVGWIRNESEQKDCPIIMVTTEFDPTKLAEVYQLGVSAICDKSFEPSLVRNIVIRIFLQA